MNNMNLEYIFKNIPNIKSRIELFPYRLALLEENFFESIACLYKARIQEFYELMTEQKALKGSSIKNNIKVTLPSFYEIDKNPMTFDYLRKLQKNMLPFLAEYLVEQAGNNKVKVFEILYGIKLMGATKYVFKAFFELTGTQFVDENSAANTLFKHFLDTSVFEYETIIFFTKMLDSIISVVIEWTDTDKYMASLYDSQFVNNLTNAETAYIQKRYINKQLTKIKNRCSSFLDHTLYYSKEVEALNKYISNPDIQFIVVMEVITICESYANNLPKPISDLFKIIYECLITDTNYSYVHKILIQYLFDYLLKKFIVLFSQTLDNLTCFHIHRQVY